MAAKAFTEAKLKDLPFITVKTHKTDIYGRYVADVFYVPAENPGEDGGVFESGDFGCGDGGAGGVRMGLGIDGFNNKTINDDI